MPNWWVEKSHADFLRSYPQEKELPWQDIGCTKFLNDIGYPYGVTLVGVYRDSKMTEVITSFATEGDLFMWCSRPQSLPPGPAREKCMRVVMRQLFDGLRQLHDLGIAHRDISLENVLATKGDQPDSLRLLIIDYGMASTSRFVSGTRGKKSYQAPESHEDGEYDAFAADVFSAGVVLWCTLVNDYPWLSTKPGADHCFEYYRKHGFEKFIRKRALRGTTTKVAEVLSEPVKELLEGLLQVDPKDRLTLGESKVFSHDDVNPTTRFHAKRSMWNEEWMQIELP